MNVKNAVILQSTAADHHVLMEFLMKNALTIKKGCAVVVVMQESVKNIICYSANYGNAL